MTDQAGVNLAAVNYHFRDKENLFQETLLRRLRELNAKRLTSLQEACALAAPAPPSLEAIIRLLAQPLFDLHRSPGPGGRSFVHLLSRGLTESSPLTARLLAEEYHPTLTRFGQLIRRHVPQLSPEEFLWRFSFIVGSLHHTLATLHQMADLTRGICRNDDYEGAMTRFVGCGVATFRAASPSRF